MILNHGKLASSSEDVQCDNEWSLLTTLPAAHSNITRIIHCYSQPVTNIPELIKPFLMNSSTVVGAIPEEKITVMITPDYPLSLDLVGLACSAHAHHPLGERCILKILLELTKALQYLKTNGIVHRDIEPCKIFVDGDLRVVLGGFGMARKVMTEDDHRPIQYVEKSQVAAGNPLAWTPELTRCYNDGPPKSYQKSVS